MQPIFYYLIEHLGFGKYILQCGNCTKTFYVEARDDDSNETCPHCKVVLSYPEGASF